jgi:hypothetical protein
MVSIVEAIMLNVVTQSGYQQRKSVNILKVGLFNHSLGLQNEVAMLSHI